MRLIKRYPNRKLYNVLAKQYITLEGIAELLQQGEEVQVTDYASGEDLTNLILTQVIVELEKKQGGFFPRNVLTGLVQAGGDTLTVLRRTVTAPLSMFGHSVDEEIARRLAGLVARGELSPEEEIVWRVKLLQPDADVPAQSWLTEGDIERLLEARGVPTRADLQSLAEQLELLATRLDGLSRIP